MHSYHSDSGKCKQELSNLLNPAFLAQRIGGNKRLYFFFHFSKGGSVKIQGGVCAALPIAVHPADALHGLLHLLNHIIDITGLVNLIRQIRAVGVIGQPL